MAASEEEEEEEEEKIKNKKQRLDEAHGSLENLPFDSVMEREILSRLPLKSILRLESASKPLYPLISDFLRRRYSLPNAAVGLFFRWPKSNNFYYALDSSTFIDGTLSSSTSPPIERIVGYCNGLLICQWSENNEKGRVVYNPLTGQCAFIPLGYYFAMLLDDPVLAFDPHISGHYNLLHFLSHKVHVFSSETGSWVEKKQLASHKARVGICFPFFFDGKIYFLSYKAPFVEMFDHQGNFLGKINLPHPEMDDCRRLLGHSCGRLHFAVKVDDEMLVWILEDHDKRQWVLKHTVCLWSIFDAGSSSSAWDHRWDHHLRAFQAFHPNVGVVFVQVKDKLFSYHMDNRDLTELCTHSWGYEVEPIFVYSPCFSRIPTCRVSSSTEKFLVGM